MKPCCHCREDMVAELTIATFARAVTQQRPLVGLIHHSDRGSQYACGAFRERLQAPWCHRQHERSGDPYDNALAESFVATLKTECFDGLIQLTRAAAKLMDFDYIESFYNRRRRQR